METSTIIFIAVLAIAFIFLRWLITPIPHAVPHEVEEIRRSFPQESNASTSATASASSTTNSTTNRRGNREINDLMIEVVQALGPQLTPEQIRYDLERSGSVEATVNRFLENGDLPFPPGYRAPAPVVEQNHNIPPSTVSLNLLEKYGIDPEQSVIDLKEENSQSWSSDKLERSSNLNKKRQEMILNARKRLAQLLQNDVSDKF